MQKIKKQNKHIIFLYLIHYPLTNGDFDEYFSNII